MDLEEELLDEIDNNLSNRYVVLEGDHDTLYVKDRRNGETLKIKVELLVN